MKPRFYITTIQETESLFAQPPQASDVIIPRQIILNLEITVLSTGNFSDYVRQDGTINKRKIGDDILDGKIDITNR